MSDAEIRERLESAVRPAFEKPFDPAADLVRGRRRRRRNRTVGGTAGCAALAAVAALIVPALPSGDGGSAGMASSAAIDPDALTYYVERSSVIHNGDREIDVSPHEVRAFTTAEDGFVFQSYDGTIYFADGVDVEQIGRSDPDLRLLSDDSGPYVAWVTPAPALETVVYDKSRQVEVFRRQLGADGCHICLNLQALDGDVVYVRTSARGDGVAWDFVADQPARWGEELVDVSSGYYSRVYWKDWDSGSATARAVIVSRDPDADGPRFPVMTGISFNERPTDLSPSGRYVLGVKSPNIVVVDRVSQENVAPAVDDRYTTGFGHHWIDDDRYVIEGDRVPAGLSALLVCSVSAGTCEVAVEGSDPFILPS
jgi:hypothetical protein